MALYYDGTAHKYFQDDVEVPSVTQILKEAGFSYAFYRDQEAQAAVGLYGHRILQLRLSGNAIDSVDPDFEPYMPGIENFIRDLNPKPYVSPARGLERIMFSPRLGYAGTGDFFGHWGLDRAKCLWCVDYKFWKNFNQLALDTSGLQTAAYKELFEDYECVKNLKRAVVHFSPEIAHTGYRIYRMPCQTDWNYFLSARNCYNWRKEHRQIKEEITS